MNKMITGAKCPEKTTTISNSINFTTIRIKATILLGPPGKSLQLCLCSGKRRKPTIKDHQLKGPVMSLRGDQTSH